MSTRVFSLRYAWDLSTELLHYIVAVDIPIFFAPIFRPLDFRIAN